MQQKYCDQGRSTALLTITWPISRARRFLRLGRQAQKGVDLSVDEELHRLDRWLDDPMDIFARIDADMRGDQASGTYAGASPRRRLPIALALQIGDAADLLIREQFEAADMHAGQDRDRHTRIDRVDAQRRKVR